MRSVHRFIDQHVTPVDRMAEMIFGLIMVLGVTGAIRLGTHDLDNRELFVSVFGCNLAWGIVDGVVFVLMRLFERGRLARLVRDARAAKDDDRAFEIIETEVSDDVLALMSPEERATLRTLALDLLARAQPKAPRLKRGDLLHGLAAGLLVVLPTIPAVVPYLIMREPLAAVRTSYVVCLVFLFLIGLRWGQLVGLSPWRVGGSITLLGIVLVAITISLGG